MLRLACERAQVVDGMDILELVVADGDLSLSELPNTIHIVALRQFLIQNHSGNLLKHEVHKKG